MATNELGLDQAFPFFSEFLAMEFRVDVFRGKRSPIFMERDSMAQMSY